jgi:hypothetical protein
MSTLSSDVERNTKNIDLAADFPDLEKWRIPPAPATGNQGGTVTVAIKMIPIKDRG